MSLDEIHIGDIILWEDSEEDECGIGKVIGKSIDTIGFYGYYLRDQDGTPKRQWVYGEALSDDIKVTVRVNINASTFG